MAKIDAPHIRLRLEHALLSRLKEAAKKNDKPLTAEITLRLVESFGSEIREKSKQHDLLKKMTITVEQAGWLLGLCRNSAYAAAARGEIPTIRVGRLLKVPTNLLRAKLSIPEASRD